jgi:hypothetical protein
MRLIVGVGNLAWRLIREKAPWIINLPGNYEIVACRVDPDRGEVLSVIRSDTFPRIAKGTLIPDFDSVFNGPKWRSGRDWRP